MKTETLKSQVKRLAEFIMQECKGYPNQSEGAIDCAIRIIKDLKEFASLNPERVREIKKGFDEAIELIKAWHNMTLSEEQGEMMWNIYKNRSPEMKRLMKIYSIISDLCSGSQGEPTKDIPLDIIEKWAEERGKTILKGMNWTPIVDEMNKLAVRCAIIGAKAMQSGEIARWAKENEG